MARIDIEDRKLALAQHLGVEVTEIKEGYNDTTFECESEHGEWLVLTDDEADDMDSDYDSMGDYFKSIYGRGWVSEADFLKDYIDFDGVADYIIDTDGRGSILSGYDGLENEEKVGNEWFYIYRTN